MRAHARVAVALASGSASGSRPGLSGAGTVVRELRSEPPLTLRSTLDGVHLVGSGAGPLGGDDLRLDVRVGPGASLDLFSVAASMAQPGPHAEPSHLLVDVDVAEGATLAFRPQPTILVQGCDHRLTNHLRVGAAAHVVWREELVLGRHHEPSGSILARLRVEVEGAVLLANDVALGPRWAGSLGPAGVGDAGVLGTLVLVGTDVDAAEIERLATDARVVEPFSGVRAAALPLDGPGVLVTVVGDGPRAVGATLDRFLAWHPTPTTTTTTPTPTPTTRSGWGGSAQGPILPSQKGF